MELLTAVQCCGSPHAGLAVLTYGTAAAALAGILERTCVTADWRQPPSLVLVTLQNINYSECPPRLSHWLASVSRVLHVGQPSQLQASNITCKTVKWEADRSLCRATILGVLSSLLAGILAAEIHRLSSAGMTKCATSVPSTIAAAKEAMA